MNTMTPPKHANVWNIVIPHPLAGRPMTEQASDWACDAYAASQAPKGWSLGGKTIQGRDRKLNRVLTVVYVRDEPNATCPFQTPVVLPALVEVRQG